MISHVKPLRCLLTWGLLFLAVYLGSLGLFLVVMVTGGPQYYLAAQALGPICFFLFGLWYFRQTPELSFGGQAAVTLAWVTLTLAGFALLMGPVYGADWTLALSAQTILAQSLHAAAMLLAGHVARKQKAGTQAPASPPIARRP